MPRPLIPVLACCVWIGLLPGCSSDDGISSQRCEDHTGPYEYDYGKIPEDGVFTDGFGRECYPFMDLAAMRIELTETDVTVTITVMGLPAQLPYNQAGVEDGHLEYKWACYFDVGNDGQRFGDLEFSLSHFKDEARGAGSAPIEEFAQKFVWKWTDDYSSKTIAALDVEIDGNSIVMTVPRSRSFALSGITENTKVFFSTYYSDGDAYRDFCPDA
jgi:hypothetical protein